MDVARVDIGVELISTILFFSKHYNITEKFLGNKHVPRITKEYELELTEWITPYLKHEVFTYVEELTYKGFFFGRPIEIMCATDFETMSLRETLSSLCVEYSGGLPCIEKLLALLKDFSESTNYKSFFQHAKKYYNKPIEYFSNHFDLNKIMFEINKFYGYDKNSYQIILTDLQCGSYGIHFNDISKRNIFAIYTMNGVTFFDEKSLETACGAFSLNILIHEFSHPYVNPLNEKFSEEVNQYKGAFDKLLAYKLPGSLSGYGNWDECVDEHIVRAIAIHLAKKIRSSVIEEWHFNRSYNAGYRYLPFLLEQLEYYDENRDRYKTFDDFYLELIKIFSKNISL